MPKQRSNIARAASHGAKFGLGYGFTISRIKHHPAGLTAVVTGTSVLTGAGIGAGVAAGNNYRKKRRGAKMAKKGSWAGGKAPAQGSAGKHKISKPVNGANKFKGNLKKGSKNLKKGTSPLDGRKRGGK